MFRELFEEHWRRQKRLEKYLNDGKFVLRFAICMCIGAIMSWILFWPTNTVFYNRGIGADSDGRVYIGEKLWIGVYENGELVDKFYEDGIENDYEFALIGDHIYIWRHWNSYHSRVLDLQGNDVDNVHDEQGPSRLSEREKHEFTAEDGRFYKLDNGLLKRARVTCYHPDGNEEVVFKMPLGLYLTKLAFFVYLPSLAVWIIRQWHMNSKKQGSGKA